MRGGQVELIVVPSADYTHIRETVTVGEGLHDNEWHALSVFYQDGYVADPTQDDSCQF